jgi:CRP/FNR family transcriptional regulator, cyclic AMP receptor protein
VSVPAATVPRGVVPVLQRPEGVEPLPLVIVTPGRNLVRQGEATRGLWRIDSGVLRAEALAPDGRELVVDLLGPGDLVGEPGSEPSPVTVRAVRPARLQPVAPTAAGPLLARRAHRAVGLACDLAWRDVPTRVEHRLVDLAARFGRPVDGGTLIPLTLTQEEIAGLAGTSRATVNRVLRAEAKKGTVELRRGRTSVLNPQALAKRAS